MTARVLICVSAYGASCARWTGKITHCERFDNDEHGWAAFDQFLKAVQDVPVHVLVDAVEEDYRFETLPHTFGTERRELLDRKIKQHYRATPYASASLQSAEKGKRKEDRFLFAAITEGEFLTPWLTVLQNRKLPIAGIYPLPVLTPVAATRLKLAAPNLLLISKHAAGMRQTFLKDGKFRITRLTPLHALGEGPIDRSFADEVRNTRMYLDAITATTADESVQVVILDQDNSLTALRDAIQATRGNMQAIRLSREDLISKLKVPLKALTTTADALHLHLLGEHVPKENLTPPSLRQSHSIYKTRRNLTWAAAAAATVAIAWCFVNMVRANNLDNEGIELGGQAARYQTLYAEMTRKFPASPVSANMLRQSVDAAFSIRDKARSPEVFFGIVSGALEATPTVVLNSLNWKHGKGADFAAVGATTQPTAARNDQQIRQVGLIAAEIAPFNGDYRTAIATIRTFAERLRENPAVDEVKVVKLPLDASSRQSLSGSTDTRTEQRLTAQFEIAVVLKETGGQKL